MPIFGRKVIIHIPTLPWVPPLDTPPARGTNDWLAIVEAVGTLPGFSAKVSSHINGRTWFWEAWKHAYKQSESKVFMRTGKTDSKGAAVKAAEDAVNGMRRQAGA